MFVQQIRSIRRFTLLPSLLLAGLFMANTALGQSPQKSLVSPELHPAEPYSYVFLDPLEGNHHAPKPDDGQHQGIQMHGHWIIDVKNPDGTVAQHRDFENTITSGGSSTLIGLLAGFNVPSDYAIGLSINNTLAPCPQVSQQYGCVIVRSLTTEPGVALCPNFSCTTGLTSTVNTTGNGSFTLAGSFTASRAGGIYDVETFIGACPNTSSSLTTVSPAACSSTASSNSYFSSLSSASITGIPVAASQIVQVTVTISFS